MSLAGRWLEYRLELHVPMYHVHVPHPLTSLPPVYIMYYVYVYINCILGRISPGLQVGFILLRTVREQLYSFGNAL